MSRVTANILIKNEEYWIWFAIQSIIDSVDEIMIYDTGSTDSTLEIINTIKSPKIKIQKRIPRSPIEITVLRNEMLDKTSSTWAFILDGDEIWNYPDFSVLDRVPRHIARVYRREIIDCNSVTKKSEDLTNIRFVMAKKGVHFYKPYPDEILKDAKGERFIWELHYEYFHVHNLERSRKDKEAFSRVSRKGLLWYMGQQEMLTHLPKVFFRNDIPEIVKEINPYLNEFKSKEMLG